MHPEKTYTLSSSRQIHKIHEVNEDAASSSQSQTLRTGQHCTTHHAAHYKRVQSMGWKPHKQRELQLHALQLLHRLRDGVVEGLNLERQHRLQHVQVHHDGGQVGAVNRPQQGCAPKVHSDGQCPHLPCKALCMTTGLVSQSSQSSL